jgi:FlaA1/EpsC-like NDP-sugar epimerase
MRGPVMSADWTEFLGRPEVASNPALAKAAAGGRRVLVTGAGGSIGSRLAWALTSGPPASRAASLILLDSSEHALYECLRHLGAPGNSAVTPVVGSCCDLALLRWLFENHKPELILHAAAYKHVPLMERNPFAAIANNSLGTYRLVMAAAEAGAVRLVMVSTDKAVNPRSIMGASKRIAELIVLSHATATFEMCAVRLGNVLGSSGSVVPVFEEQIRRGVPLTVTDPEATRFFMTLGEVEAAVLKAAASGVSGKILVPEFGEARRIVDLARYIAGDAKAPIEFGGLRPGDKLHEELVAGDEEIAAEKVGDMRVVTSTAPSKEAVAAAVAELGRAVACFDSAALLSAVAKLVPGYAPALAAEFPVEAEVR